LSFKKISSGSNPEGLIFGNDYFLSHASPYCIGSPATADLHPSAVIQLHLNFRSRNEPQITATSLQRPSAINGEHPDPGLGRALMERTGQFVSTLSGNSRFKAISLYI
jgi:hypothetical protein